MKVVAVIAARMGSSRLPGKTLMPILGKPMLERMIERIRYSRHINNIVIATTSLAKDDEVADFASRVKVNCFRGLEEDVLARICQAVVDSKADLAIELLGDNPLIHADLIDEVIDFYLANEFDYGVNATTEHPYAGENIAKFPIGIRAEVFTPQVLEKCERLATESYHRENTTSYIYQHPDLFTTGYLEAKGKWEFLNRPELTFAVNYRENFDLVSRLFEICYPKNANFSLFDLLQAFDSEPELAKLMGNPL